MGIRINTNVNSLAAQRNLSSTSTSQAKSLEKLSSGTRINHAADDAAGLAISEKMRASVRSLAQDMRNANDGISMIQTAEGAMNEVGNILVRFRELSIQASSDTIGDTERAFIDKEVNQMHEEINRIAQSTEYNGNHLLSGEGGKFEIQVGLNNNAEQDRFYYDASKTNVSTSALGVEGISVKSRGEAQENLEKIDGAMKTLTENRAELGALQNRLQSTVSNIGIYSENLQGARSRIADVDMASETAELTRSNILTQSGASVLSQANQNSMIALKLLG